MTTKISNLMILLIAVFFLANCDSSSDDSTQTDLSNSILTFSVSTAGSESDIDLNIANIQISEDGESWESIYSESQIISLTIGEEQELFSIPIKTGRYEIL